MKSDLPPQGLTTRPKLRGDAGFIVLFRTIAALYFAREILIPFAFALTLTFLLAPVVALLQRLHTGRVVSVLSVLVSIVAAGGMAGSSRTARLPIGCLNEAARPIVRPSPANPSFSPAWANADGAQGLVESGGGHGRDG
jgi:hypothetical protein